MQKVFFFFKMHERMDRWDLRVYYARTIDLISFALYSPRVSSFFITCVTLFVTREDSGRFLLSFF